MDSASDGANELPYTSVAQMLLTHDPVFDDASKVQVGVPAPEQSAFVTQVSVFGASLLTHRAFRVSHTGNAALHASATPSVFASSLL